MPRSEDVYKFIMNARQSYKATITILYEGGPRRCEALSLHYGDVKPWDVSYRVWVRKSKSLPRAVSIIKYAYIRANPASLSESIRPSALSAYIYRLWLSSST